MHTRGRPEELRPRRWRCIYCPPERPNVVTLIGEPPDRCERCGNRAAFIAEDLADQLQKPPEEV